MGIDWHDWAQPSGYGTIPGQIAAKPPMPSAADQGRAGRPSRIHNTSPHEEAEVTLPADLKPMEARWTPDRKTIVFTAQGKIGPDGRTRGHHPDRCGGLT